MASAMFSWNKGDFLRGAVSACFAAAMFVVAGLAQQPDFDVFSADWATIGSSAFNAAIAALFGYLGKNFVTDKDGKVFGKIG